MAGSSIVLENVSSAIMGHIGAIRGEVFILRAVGGLTVAKKGDPIYEDDIISTKENAAALVYAPSGEVLTFGRSATVQFNPILIEKISSDFSNASLGLGQKTSFEFLEQLIAKGEDIESLLQSPAANQEEPLDIPLSENTETPESAVIVWQRTGSEIIPIGGFVPSDLRPDNNFSTNQIGNLSASSDDEGNRQDTSARETEVVLPNLISNDDALVVIEDSEANFGNVSSNDSTRNGDPLSYSLVENAGVQHGTLIFNSDGTYSYTPSENYNGADSFQYIVKDVAGDESAVHTVNITVSSATDLVTSPEEKVLNEDTSVGGSVADGDSTTSGGVLTYTLVSGPSNGVLSSPINSVTGNFTYQPNADYVGSDSFQYLVIDANSGESRVETVSITVNPVVDLSGVDDALVVPYNTLTAGDVSINDSTTSSGGNANLTFQKLSNPANGVLVFSADGTYTYNPTGFGIEGGADSFTYLVTDPASGESSVQTVNITVNPGNLPPEGTNNSSTIDEDSSYILQLADFGFTDADGDTFKAVRIDTLATAGTLTLSGIPVVAEQVITVADISANNLVFTPDANGNGSPYGTFTFSVQASNDAFDTTPNTFTLNVNSVNDIPDGADNSATVDEDNNHILTVSDFGFSDVDGDALKAVRIDTLATAGTLMLSGIPVVADQFISEADITAGNLIYVPDANAHGTPYGSFTFTVQDINDAFADASNTFTLNVNSVNDAPEGTDNSTTIDEDNTYTLLVADFGFSDVVEGDSFTGVRIDTLPALGALTLSGIAVTAGQIILTTDIAAGELVFTPIANGHGTPYSSFTFSVQDSGGAIDTVPNTFTVNVNSVADLPVAENDSYEVIQNTEFTATLANGVLLNDSDGDGDTLTVDTTPISDVSNGTLVLNSDGTFTYTPNLDFNGSDSFIYEIDDGTGNTTQATVNIDVDYASGSVIGSSEGDGDNEDTGLQGEELRDDDIYSGGLGNGERENVQGVGTEALQTNSQDVRATTAANIDRSGNDRLIIDGDDTYADNASNNNGHIRVRGFTVGDVETSPNADTLVIGDLLRHDGNAAGFLNTAEDAVRFLHFQEVNSSVMLLYIDRDGGFIDGASRAGADYAAKSAGANYMIEFRTLNNPVDNVFNFEQGHTLNTADQVQALVDLGFLDIS